MENAVSLQYSITKWSVILSAILFSLSPAQAKKKINFSLNTDYLKGITVEDLGLNKKENTYTFRTNHFEFIVDTKISRDLLTQLTIIYETAYKVHETVLFGTKAPFPKGQSRFRTRFYSRTVDYYKNGGLKNTPAFFQYGTTTCLISVDLQRLSRKQRKEDPPLSAHSIRILLHEITHQLMHDIISQLPLWYIEGAAEYMGATYKGSYGISAINMDNKILHTIKLRGIKNRDVTLPPLKDYLHINHASWLEHVQFAPQKAQTHYTAALLLTHYFYNMDGLGKGTAIKKFLHAIKTGEPLEKAHRHLFRGRSYEHLQRDIQQAWAKKRLRIVFAEEPSSP